MGATHLAIWSLRLSRQSLPLFFDCGCSGAAGFSFREGGGFSGGVHRWFYFWLFVVNDRLAFERDDAEARSDYLGCRRADLTESFQFRLAFEFGFGAFHF